MLYVGQFRTSSTKFDQGANDAIESLILWVPIIGGLAMNNGPKAVIHTFCQNAYRLLEADKPTKTAYWTRIILAVIIVINVAAVVFESDAALSSTYQTLFQVINLVSVIIFTFEYVSRLFAATANPEFKGASWWHGPRAYFCSGMGIIDLLAIAPFWLGFLVSWDLRHLRAVRLLRLLKLHRNFNSLEVFYKVFRSQIPNLLGVTLVILILLVLSSSFMYAVESNSSVVETVHVTQSETGTRSDEFGNISRAMWWSVVTLTSVGYGDVIPKTDAGKFIGSLIMLLGVGLVALPAAILGGKFANELQIRRLKVVRQAMDKLRDGEIDAEERDALVQSGRQQGFSEEEIDEIAEAARESIDDLRSCPKCGYIDAKNS